MFGACFVIENSTANTTQETTNTEAVVHEEGRGEIDRSPNPPNLPAGKLTQRLYTDISTAVAMGVVYTMNYVVILILLTLIHAPNKMMCLLCS